LVVGLYVQDEALSKGWLKGYGCLAKEVKGLFPQNGAYIHNERIFQHKRAKGLFQRAVVVQRYVVFAIQDKGH